MEKRITITIDADVLHQIDEKAKETLRSRAKFIEYILRKYLKEEEIFKKLEK